MTAPVGTEAGYDLRMRATLLLLCLAELSCRTASSTGCLGFMQAQFARNPTPALYRERVQWCRQKGDIESLQQALADVDRLETLAPSKDLASIRGHVHCELYPKTKQPSDRAACLAVMERTFSARLDSGRALEIRARIFEEVAGDPARALEDLLEVIRLTKAGAHHGQLQRLYARAERQCEAMIAKTSGTSEQDRYRAIAERLRTEHAAFDREAAAVAKLYERPARTAPPDAAAPRPSPPLHARSEAERKQAAADEERAKGIEKYGVCPWCRGRGKIRIVRPDRYNPEDYLEDCRNCQGTGAKGPGYSGYAYYDKRILEQP